MNGQAGKGDKWRKGTNFGAYYDNYDTIFRKKDGPLFLKGDTQIRYVYLDSGEVYFYGPDKETEVPYPDYLPGYIPNMEQFIKDNNLTLIP